MDTDKTYYYNKHTDTYTPKMATIIKETEQVTKYPFYSKKYKMIFKNFKSFKRFDDYLKKRNYVLYRMGKRSTPYTYESDAKRSKNVSTRKNIWGY